MKIGTILFHQGWTDIINCLPLINLFSLQYDKINLIIRKDSKSIIDFYVSQFNNVEIIYTEKYELDNNLHLIVPQYEDTELLFFGVHDAYRKNNYINSFRGTNGEDFFVKKFYTCYGIDYINRINSFDIVRNFNLEDKIYEDFKLKNGEDYVLYHEDTNRDIFLNKENFNKNYNSIDLNGISDVFFDYIKVLENAKEIHLFDSVWASVIYLLDSKYGLFKHIPIYVNCLRGYNLMFTEPIKLNNWFVK
jgi:hypothetical protein